LYSVESSYQKAIVDECHAISIDIERFVDIDEGRGMSDSVAFGDRSTLGDSMVLVSSSGN